MSAAAARPLLLGGVGGGRVYIYTHNIHIYVYVHVHIYIYIHAYIRVHTKLTGVSAAVRLLLLGGVGGGRVYIYTYNICT